MTQPLGIGVCGLGRAYLLMRDTFARDPRVRIVAGADPHPDNRQAFAAAHGVETFEDIEALCRHPQVQAVYIASPHEWHARHVAIAAAHHRHVLVEKPMTISLEAAHDMVEAARRAGVHVIVGPCHSFDAPVLATRELVRSGQWGRVRMIHAMDYTDFLYRPRRPEELDTAQGGGVVFSQAAHQVDIARLLGGGLVTSVFAHTGRWDPQRPTEGAYSALLSFADGAFASLTYSGYAHFDSDELVGWVSEVGFAKNPAQHGSARRALAAAAARDPATEAALKRRATVARLAGMPPHPRTHEHFGGLIVGCDHADIRVLPDRLVIYGDDVVETRPLAPPAVPRREVIDELVAAVRDDRPPLHDAAWGRATVEICLAILTSARERRVVTPLHQCTPRA